MITRLLHPSSPLCKKILSFPIGKMKNFILAPPDAKSIKPNFSVRLYCCCINCLLGEGMQPLSLCESTLVRLLLCAKSSNNGILLSKVFLSPVIKLYAPFAGKKQHFRLIKCLELEKVSFEMGRKEKICIAKEAHCV